MCLLLGRILSSVENIAKELEVGHYLISGNGALAYDMQKSEILYENDIPKETLLQLIEICDNNSIYYNLYTEEEVITKSLNYNVSFYHYENSKKSQTKKTRIHIVQNIYEYVKEAQQKHFLKMTVCDKDSSIFSSIVRKLRKVKGIDVLDISHMSRKWIKEGTEKVSIEYFYTEITKEGTDKWNAIEKIMEKERIANEEVLAIGDNMNDKKMIKMAGLGVAMGHSIPALKQVANYITKDNNQNGVSAVIHEFVLQNYKFIT